MPKKERNQSGRARRAGSAAKPPSRSELRLALTDALTRVLEQFYPDLSEEEVRRMMPETPAAPRVMTEDEIAATGTPIKVEEARPKRGGRRGRSPGPWVSIALGLSAGEGLVWHNIPEGEAKTAQSNVTNKRRRDGKDARGRWITPIWVNIEQESVGYRVIVVNDPDREAHDAME